MADDFFGGLLGTETVDEIPTTNLNPTPDTVAVPSTGAGTGTGPLNSGLNEIPTTSVPASVPATDGAASSNSATSGGSSGSSLIESESSPLLPITNSDTEDDESSSRTGTAPPTLTGNQILSSPSTAVLSTPASVSASTPSTHPLSTSTGTGTTGLLSSASGLGTGTANGTLSGLVSSTRSATLASSAVTSLSNNTLSTTLGTGSVESTSTSSSEEVSSTEEAATTEAPTSQEMIESVATSKGQDTTLFITSLVPAPSASGGRTNAAAANVEQEAGILNSESKLFPLGVVLVVAGGLIAVIAAIVLTMRCVGVTRRRRRLRAAIPSFFPTMPEATPFPDREKFDDLTHPAATHAADPGYAEYTIGSTMPGGGEYSDRAGAPGAMAGAGAGMAGVGGYGAYNQSQTQGYPQGQGHTRSGSYEYDYSQPQTQIQTQPRPYISENRFNAPQSNVNVVDPYDGAAFYPAQTYGSNPLSNATLGRNNSQSSTSSYSDTQRSDAYVNGHGGRLPQAGSEQDGRMYPRHVRQGSGDSAGHNKLGNGRGWQMDYV